MKAIRLRWSFLIGNMQKWNFVYGLCDGNASAAQREYRIHYPVVLFPSSDFISVSTIFHHQCFLIRGIFYSTIFFCTRTTKAHRCLIQIQLLKLIILKLNEWASFKIICIFIIKKNMTNYQIQTCLNIFKFDNCLTKSKVK